jgi:hypothetical protein
MRNHEEPPSSVREGANLCACGEQIGMSLWDMSPGALRHSPDTLWFEVPCCREGMVRNRLEA